MGFRRLLVAVDESAVAAKAVELGIELAVSLKAEVALLHVVEPAAVLAGGTGTPPGDLLRLMEDDGRALLRKFGMRAGSPPLQFVRCGAPAAEVLRFADEWQADLIVMGSHGRGRVAQLVLGSVAQAVLRDASCPVMVVGSKE